MRQVIPKPHQSRVLRDLTAQPIEFFMKEVEVPSPNFIVLSPCSFYSLLHSLLLLSNFMCL